MEFDGDGDGLMNNETASFWAQTFWDSDYAIEAVFIPIGDGSRGDDVIGYYEIIDFQDPSMTPLMELLVVSV